MTFRLLLFALCVLALPSMAQDAGDGLLGKYLKQLPDTGSQKDISKIASVQSQTPLDKEELAFKVMIPNNWNASIPQNITDYGLKEKSLFEVAKYSGEILPEGASSVSVNILKIPYETTAAQWLLHYVLRGSYILRGLEETDSHKANALYVSFDDGVAYAVRASAIISGKYLILIQYKMPADRWDDEKALQAAVIDSFTLENQSYGYMEETKTKFFLDIASIDYPASWRLSASSIRSIDRMTMDLFNITANNSLDGEMHIVMLSKYSGAPVAKEIELLKDGLLAKGLSFGDKIEDRHDMTYPKEMTLAVTEAYDSKSDNKQMPPYEFWFTVMTSEDYTYIITLLTPTRDDDYFVWARNVQSYKLVVSSFKINQESK